MKLSTSGFFLFLVISFFFFETMAQTPNFDWTKKAGGTGRDQGYALTTDLYGNIYVTGEFTGTASFGPNVTLTSSGNVDYFLVKYDSLGNAIWGKKGGGTLTDRGYGVVVGKDGFPVTTGHYFGACTFDNVTFTSSGNLDAFIAKYNSDGNLLWIKDGKSVSQTSPRAIAVDKDDNYIVAGYFGTSGSLTAVFDSVTLTAVGQRDIYLLKYNSKGEIQWGVSAGGNATGEEPKDVTCDAAGNIYLTGVFKDTAYFGSKTLYGNGGNDIFVAKYNPSGKLAWVKGMGGLKDDEGSGIALDGKGNLYIGGRIDSAAVIGNTSILSSGLYEALIIKCDTSGNILWVKNGGGAANDYMNSVVCDQTGVIGMGSFITSANFGGTPVVSNGVDDLYFIKYNANGDLMWIKSAGGTEKEAANRLVLDKAGNALGTGSFRATATFGSDILTTSGIEDVFLTKIKGAGTIPVELTAFSAQFKNNLVQLNWTTATEKNNFGFEVQRSFDNITFSAISSVPGNGTSTQKHEYSFVDNNIHADKYYYRLKQIDFDGTSTFSSVAAVEISRPEDFKLMQNYPNPFNPSTAISYQLPASSKVSLKIFDVLGKEIVTLVNQEQNAGRYNVKFDAGSKNLASGIYYYRLQVTNLSTGFSETKKMILNK